LPQLFFLPHRGVESKTPESKESTGDDGEESGLGSEEPEEWIPTAFVRG
jgi:hypothetical protein